MSADRHPLSCVPAWSNTSISRIMRGSCILMPAILVLPAITGRAMRCNSAKSTVHVQGLRFETGQAIRNADHSLAQAFQILQPLVEAEVLHPVYAHFHSQESAELFVHTAHQVLAVDAQHVVAMVELFEHTMQFAAQPLGDAHPEDMSHFVGGQAEQSHFAGALQNLVDGEVPLADEVPA